MRKMKIHIIELNQKNNLFLITVSFLCSLWRATFILGGEIYQKFYLNAICMVIRADRCTRERYGGSQSSYANAITSCSLLSTTS